ncbi:MAG: hypothetical protein PHN82_08605 [bacterium]|nr:hypothetical protein [bacterium]
MARGKKKRPAVEWLRWARKPFLLAFYSLGALLFLGLERIEALLGGKASPAAKPAPLSRKLTVTLSLDEDKADVILPFVPLFGGDSKWIKLKAEYVIKNLRCEGGALTLTGHLSSSSAPEGPHRVDAVAFLSSQREVAAFLRELDAGRVPIAVTSVLSTRRTGAVPHAKGLLLKIAVGSRKIELAPVKGAEELSGAGAAAMADFFPKTGEYHHLFIAADTAAMDGCLSRIAAKGRDEMNLSVYACLNLALEVLIPVFLLEPPSEKVRMEDACLLLLEIPEAAEAAEAAPA